MKENKIPSFVRDGREKALETEDLTVKAVINGQVFKVTIPYGSFAGYVAKHREEIGIASLEEECRMVRDHALATEELVRFLSQSFSVLESPLNQGEQEAYFSFFNFVHFSREIGEGKINLIPDNQTRGRLLSAFLRSIFDKNILFVYGQLAKTGSFVMSLTTPVEESVIFLTKREEEETIEIGLLIANSAGLTEWLRQQGERGIHY